MQKSAHWFVLNKSVYWLLHNLHSIHAENWVKLFWKVLIIGVLRQLGPIEEWCVSIFWIELQQHNDLKLPYLVFASLPRTLNGGNDFSLPPIFPIEKTMMQKCLIKKESSEFNMKCIIFYEFCFYLKYEKNSLKNYIS